MTPQRFRKKPVVVEAMQWNEGSHEQALEIQAWAGEDAIPHIDRATRLDYICVETLEGDMYASPDDWIIKGVAGEFYPCKPEIFAATYESVDTPQVVIRQPMVTREEFVRLISNDNRIDDES